MYSGGSLVKAEESFDAVRRGLVDMAWGVTGYTPGRFKVADIPEIPFEANNVLEASSGVWALHENDLMDGFEDVYVLDFVKWHIDAPLGSSSVFVVINKKKFDALPEAAKAALEKHGGKIFVSRWSAGLEANRSACN